MKKNLAIYITPAIVFAALALLLGVAAQHSAAQNQNAWHHHYILRDLGTFGGPGSTPTEFQQVLNDSGTLVGGADTPALNPYPNCFNPFNAPDCYVQHAFVWQDGKLTDLGTIRGGSASFPYFISDNGLIAGGSENGVIDPFLGTPETHAVLWSNGRMTDLGTLGGTSSLATGVNDAGQVIGGAQNTIPDPFSGDGTQGRAFIWQDGEMYDLGTLGGPDAFAQFLNNSGQVAGVSFTSYIADPNTGLPPLHPFLWEKAKGMKDLGNLGGTNDSLGPFIFGINNRGEVAGVMALPGDQIYHAFLWDGEELLDLNAWGGGLGGNYSNANGLNDAGEVIGWATPEGDQVNHAVLWSNGAITDLGTLHGDPCSTSESINSIGQIVGASQAACDQFTEAFLWENGGPIVDLNTLVPSGSSLKLTGAFWINDGGEITGRGVPPGCGDVDTCGHAFLLIPCDANHPNIAGCDYSPVEAATVTEVRPAAASPASAAAASEGKLSPAELAARIRSMANRYRRFGTLPRP